MPDSNNKLIYKNTLIIYARMLFVTFVGLFSSRFVLQALGTSDYGLYNVVGGLIALFNFLGSAMSTTSRRYINFEMGKPDGNLNKVFNICLVLHICFAAFILLIAETFGVWYVNNILNVAEGKLNDAMFVFQISAIVACIGIINIPYMSLIEANEKFGVSAIIDTSTTAIKFGLVIVLLYYQGNALRFYALLMCGVSLLSFLLYHLVCFRKWPTVIKHKLYKRTTMYKEILVFNNYIALGALSSIGRSQGTNMIVNYFFGTIVNAAFAVAHLVETYVYMFVNKLTQASYPQVAINYSGDKMTRVNALVENNSRLCILIMTVFFFPLIAEIVFILDLWLKDVPEGAVLLCILTLISCLVASFGEGTNGYVQASGKIKWFQLYSSVFSLVNLPLGYMLFKLGFDAYWIVICYIITSVLWRIISLIMMKRILGFDLANYFKRAYLPPLLVIAIMSCIVFIYRLVPLTTVSLHLLGFVVILTITANIVFFVGLSCAERRSLIGFVSSKLHHKTLSVKS